jgi:hypothetical protein
LPFDINAIQVIDTYEQLAFAYDWAPEEIGLLHVLFGNHHLSADIHSAELKNAGRSWDDRETGLYQKLKNGSADGDAQREVVQHYLERLPSVVLTSDWKCQWIAFHELYGLDEPVITSDNWEELDRKIRDAYADRESWHTDILRRAGIKTLFWCYGPPLLKSHCRGVLLLTDFLHLRKGNISEPDELAGQFRSWIEMEIQRYNPVALQIDSAYRRDICFENPDAKEVARGLAKLGEEEPFSSHRAISDFIHQLAAEWSSRHALPLQIHTGLLSGNVYRHRMNEIFAHHLETYIAEHPETAFDIFHSGFPHWEEGMVLCRRYPNAYLNLCWLTSISESLTHSVLETALEAVPVNKILWGGGAQSPEMAFGVLTLFRSILERVLYMKDIPDEPKEEIADKLLWKNASKLYHLN